MGFIIGLLTFLLVLDCIVLIFLVLIQLPKKEAGAGLAFGAGATDALFGAGSGTVLTKVTKYAAATFFVLAFVLAVMQKHRSTSSTTEFERRLANPQTETLPSGTAKAPATTPANGAATRIPPNQNPNPPLQVTSNLLSVPSAPATGIPVPAQGTPPAK